MLISKRIFINILNIILLSFSVISTDSFKYSNFMSKWANFIILCLLIVFFAISFIYNDVSFNQFLFIVILLFFSTIISYNSKSSKLFLLVLYVLSCRSLTINESLFDMFLSKVFTMTVTFCLFIFGHLNDLNNNELGRHSFGFGQPNILGASIFVFEILLFTYLFANDNINIFKVIFALLIQIPMVYLLIKSGSASSLICLILFVIIIILRKYTSKNLSLFEWLIIIGTPTISLLLLNNSVDSIGSILYKLNTILTNRLHLSLYFFNKYGFTLFGQRILYNFNLSQINTYAFLDNAYLELLIHYGLIAFFSVIIYHLVIRSKCLKYNKNYIIPIILVLSIYGFVEQGYDQFWVNPIFGLSSILFMKKEINR